MKRKNTGRKLSIPFTSLAIVCLVCTQAFAQTVQVDPGTEYQTIRGFGGMNGVGWIDDLTPAQVETAFGSSSNQLGLSIMRVRIDTSPNNWAIQVPAAAQAHAMGAIILATPWSPPAHMKSNNSLINGGKLLPEFYQDYATHLLDFADYMARNNAPLHAISLQNEPDWHPDYPSAEWAPEDFVHFLNTQGSRFGDLQVVAAESLRFNRIYTDPILHSESASQYLDIVGGHLYGSTIPEDYPLAREKGKEVWMTEHYTDSTSSANDWPLALDVGTELHQSMTANFNAYIWWYIRRFYGLMTDDGNISKRGYILSQYARFVRPGFTRIESTENPHSDVFVTAYKGPDGQMVLVMVNTGNAHRYIELDLQGAGQGSFVKYSTSDSLNVGYGGTYNVENGTTSFYVDPQSVATFVSEGINSGNGSSSSSSQSSSSESSVSSSQSSSSSSSAAAGNCSYEVTNEWNTGFTAAIRIRNDGTSAINSWNVEWAYHDGTEITNSWNASLSGSDPYFASGVSWNASIQPGQTVEFGFQGNKGSGVALAPAVAGDVCQ